MSMTIADLILESNKTARSKGWWEMDLDLDDAIIRKMEYNSKRPYRHGNKKA